MDAEMALNNRRKSIVIKLALIFGAMIIFLTFFSKTINNTLLPVVDTVKVKKGSIGRTIEKTGQVELLNKENVYATGAWKVTDVFVKKNDCVTEGMVLAVVEKEDISLTLKQKELEILKLENSINELSASYENGVSEQERLIELAKREMDDAKEELESLEQLFNAGVETKDNVDRAKRRYEDAKYDYEDKKNKLERSRGTYETNLKERMAELELRKKELEKLKKDYSGMGEIKAPSDGIILEVNIDKGMMTAPNQTLFVVGRDDKKYRLSWLMSRSEAEDFDIGDEVAIKLEVQKTVDNESEDSKGDGKKSAKKSKNTTEWVEVTKNGPIQGKEYVPELKQYRYWVDIELEEGSVLEGSDVEFRLQNTEKSMTWLSPEAALLKAGGRQVCL
ncbi:TolC family protein [Acetivibrio thermocellus]|uniref:HlyD family secretion protein n=1 Tax=Acetivibrio thermocellus TaxID=1515 RepID=UPI0021AE0878|nr:TolC family protein [Acetivibrio thermocellus]UWV46698.1 TolC family protein [Acetivibrio thermocellus]